MVLSKFERLPSELFVEISDYLDACDLYTAFYGLNYRINTILDQRCHRLHINFILMPKTKFDFYCKCIIPRVSARVISLTLSGNNDSSTPGQLQLFLSRFKPLAKFFTRLESFKLINYFKSDVEMLLPEFIMLNQLKQLSIGEYQRLVPFDIDSNALFQEHVTLPVHIRNLAFPYEISNTWLQTFNPTKSFLIERLHVHLIHMNALLSFLTIFPHLKRLDTIITGVDTSTAQMQITSDANFSLHRLRYLNINITREVVFNDFAILLSNLPELHFLSVEAVNPALEFLEAQQWENILPPKLSIFRFDFHMTLIEHPGHETLLKEFKSHFWISRGWFVQCNLRNNGQYFRLFTTDSPIITNFYWPDDEILFDSTDTLVYPYVTHTELWWNLSKTTYSICPNIRSIRFYGNDNHNDESIHPNVLKMLRSPSFEHIIIIGEIQINHERFASILINSSINVQKLTCTSYWLITMLEEKQFEWIRLLTTMSIRKLVVVDDGHTISNQHLISFCQTFINLTEVTMSMASKEDLFFLLNTLENLTMANIKLLPAILDDITDYRKMIKENTALDNFAIYKHLTAFNNCSLLLWIGSRCTSHLMRTKNRLYLQSLKNH